VVSIGKYMLYDRPIVIKYLDVDWVISKQAPSTRDGCWLSWWIDELLAEIYFLWEYRLDNVGNLLEEGMKHKL